MTDEGKKDDSSQGQTQDTDTGSGAPEKVPDGQKKSGEMVFTQDQVNSFLADERRRWADKSKKESDEQQLELEKVALKDKEEWKELYDKTQEELAANKRLLELQGLKIMRGRVASEVGLPAELVDRLVGDTEDDVKADAEKLMKVVGKGSDDKEHVGTPGGDGGSSKNSGGSDDKKRVSEIKEKIAGRFGYADTL